MTIGVFDSGVGGRAVAKAIEIALPDASIVIREDRANIPYGSKSPDELMRLVTPILTEMVSAGCDVIVIACNTVSTLLITQLRDVFDVPLIAMEPMIKPAAEQTKSKVIAVCATPSTLISPRYVWLKETYAEGVTVLEPDCSDWAFMIENNAIEGRLISERIADVLQQGADIIVLGCTHYHWIEHQIRILCEGQARVMQPEQPVIAQLQRVIARLP